MLFACLLGSVATSRAEDRTPFDAWARTLAHEGTWKGKTVQVPAIEARPNEAAQLLTSFEAPLAVHAPGDVAPETAKRTLRALESAYAALKAAGFALPGLDGGLGGTAGFDVYLTPQTLDVTVGYDGADHLSAYDGAQVFGRADPQLPAEDLSACMTSLLAEAGLYALDAAESTTMRKATAAYASYLVTGRFGCGAEDRSMQAQPERGLLHANAVSATALFLAVLSERQDGGTGHFMQQMWRFAQQDSRNALTLRASPDVWEATQVALENAHEDAEDLIIDFSVARYFAGPAARANYAPYATLRKLNSSQEVPVFARVDATKLPRHIYGQRDLEPYGSAYVEVDGSALTAGEELRVWLRGDPDARWSLVAVRLAQSGEELGRVSAPPASKAGAYLPLLWTEDTDHVLLVVTRLPKTALDVDERAPGACGFKLMIDRAASAPP